MQLAVNKAHKPCRAYHQELQVFQERWFFAFYFMPVKLPDPCQYKQHYANQPQWCGKTSFYPMTGEQARKAKQRHADPQAARQKHVIQYYYGHNDDGKIQSMIRVKCKRKFHRVQQAGYRKEYRGHAYPVYQFVGMVPVAFTIFRQPLVDRFHGGFFFKLRKIPAYIC